MKRVPSPTLAGVVLGVFFGGILFGTLLGANLLQVASLGLRPFSRRAFRAVNREIADTWWGWCVSLARRQGICVVQSGDALPFQEDAIVFSNHQQMPDITFLFFVARACGRLGDLKWFVKKSLKWVPGAGWGLQFLDCLFVDRDWAKDQDSIRATFDRLVTEQVPFWLVSFPEGTRFTEEKREAARAWAESEGLELTRHVLIPRPNGFVASVQGLRKRAAAVYDVTIAYPDGVPTLGQYTLGRVKVAHIHVRRFPVGELPRDAAALAAWLRERFVEKDRRLERFHRVGSLSD